MILGVPNLLGFAAATAFGFLLRLLIPFVRRSQVLAAVDLVSGIAAVLAGVLLLKLGGFEPDMWLPISSAVWFAIHFWLINGFTQFIFSTIGVIGGWGLYLCH